MPPAIPQEPDRVDPSEVVNLGQLAALLRRLRLRVGNPGLREIERLGRQHGHVLPRSTVADVLAGRRQPRREMLLALIRVFDVPDTDVPAWIAAWEKAVTVRLLGSPVGRLPVTEDGSTRRTSLSPDVEQDLWLFTDGEPVTVVCARLPDALRRMIPFSEPRDPDYIELLTYADPDALLHLYGHLRALNPDLEVRFLTVDEMHHNDYATHLVILGGTDFNVLTRDMLSSFHLPVRMPLRSAGSDWAGIEVEDNGEFRRFEPVLEDAYGSRIRYEDVMLFFRGTNPINRRCTITLCAGVFARGTLAAVRCLTDPVLGSRNQAYLRNGIATNPHFGFVARAFVINGVVAPPDLTMPEHRLYEWTRP